jgi:hypothetical protein
MSEERPLAPELSLATKADREWKGNRQDLHVLLLAA